MRRTTLVSWIVGPSAMGSEKGTPSSMMSAPPSCMESKIGTVSLTVGYPAVTKVTSAGLVCGRGQLCAHERKARTRTELFFSAKTFLIASMMAEGEGDVDGVKAGGQSFYGSGGI